MNKQVTCNKCGTGFQTNRKDFSRIRCPMCGLNESLSIREGHHLSDQLLKIIQTFSDKICDVCEQLTRGDWVDKHGHSVWLNKEMLNLRNAVPEARELIKRIES